MTRTRCSSTPSALTLVKPVGSTVRTDALERRPRHPSARAARVRRARCAPRRATAPRPRLRASPGSPTSISGWPAATTPALSCRTASTRPSTGERMGTVSSGWPGLARGGVAQRGERELELVAGHLDGRGRVAARRLRSSLHAAARRVELRLRDQAPCRPGPRGARTPPRRAPPRRRPAERRPRDASARSARRPRGLGLGAAALVECRRVAADRGWRASHRAVRRRPRRDRCGAGSRPPERSST